MGQRARRNRGSAKHTGAQDHAAEDYSLDEVMAFLRRPVVWLVLVALVFCGTRLWLLAFFEPQMPDTVYYATLALRGVDLKETAYSDFPVEYPPVAWWAIALPRVIDPVTYQNAFTNESLQRYVSWYFSCFHGEMFVVDLICLGLMYLMGRRFLPKAPWLLPGAYLLVTLGQPHLVFDRLDLGLLMFFLLTMECWLRSLDDSLEANAWAVTSYLFLGLGISYKIVPVILVPYLLLADFWAAGSVGRFLGRVGAVVGATLGPFLVYVPFAGWGVLDLFKYHSERGTNLESTWASIMLLAHKFGVPCEVYRSHGGFNLRGDWSDVLKYVSSGTMLATAAFLGLWALLRGRRYDRRTALDAALLALINSTVLSHVYSPQFLMWLIPMSLLLALNVLPRHWAMWTLYLLMVGLVLGISGWMFPNRWTEFTNLEPLPVNLVITRSACLWGTALLLTVSFFAKYGLIPWRTNRAERNAPIAVAA